MRANHRLLYVLVGTLSLVLPSAAKAESLREAVISALANHPAMDVAAAQKDIATEGRREEFSNLFPEINTSATGGRMFGNNSTSRGLSVSRGEAYSWLWEGNATITQPLFDGFETYNRIDAAKARESAADYALADAREGIALRAAQAYFNVMRATEAHDKVESYKDKIADYVTRINSMVESGAGDETEAAQAKNIQAQLDNSAAEMDGQVKLALADYNEATGSMPVGALSKTDDLDSSLFANVDEAIFYASQNHPLVLSAQEDLAAEEEEVGAEKGILFPALDGELSYLKRDQKEEIGGEVEDGRAVMRMNWGFSTGGGQLARIRKAKAERSEALARIAQTKRQIERDIRRAFVEIETAQKQKDLNSKRADVTKNLRDTYEQQFEASKVRVLQLMQAENQLFTTELEQINSSYRVKLAEYNVLASSGRLLDVLHVDAGDASAAVDPAAGAQPIAPTIESKDAIKAEPAIETTPAVSSDAVLDVIPAAETKSTVYPASDYPKENIDTAPKSGE